MRIYKTFNGFNASGLIPLMWAMFNIDSRCPLKRMKNK